MAYSDLKDTCAFYGFTYCPLTESEYDTLASMGLSIDDIYMVANDVWAGYTIEESLAARGANETTEQWQEGIGYTCFAPIEGIGYE